MQRPRHVRNGIEVEEVAQLKAVVGHANYQVDPFAALQFHLHSTLPLPEATPRRESAVRKKEKAASSGNNNGSGGGSGRNSNKSGAQQQKPGHRSASRGRKGR
jgi:hypothetical protein